LTSFRRH